MHYVFSGFLRQLQAGDFGGTFQPGLVIPISWTLRNATGGFVTNRSAVANLQIAPNPTCSVGGGGDALRPVSPGLLLLGPVYNFDWITLGVPSGCYTIALGLDDGTVQTTIVALDKRRGRN